MGGAWPWWAAGPFFMTVEAPSAHRKICRTVSNSLIRWSPSVQYRQLVKALKPYTVQLQILLADNRL